MAVSDPTMNTTIDGTMDTGLLATQHVVAGANRFDTGPTTYDLVVIGGELAIRAAREAATLGGRIALALNRGEDTEAVTAARMARRAMIVAGRRGTSAAQATWAKFELGAKSSTDTSPRAAALAELDARGVSVRPGHAVFTGPNSVAIHGEEVYFERAIIAVDGRTTMAGIANAEQTAPIIASDLVKIARLPRRVAIVGGTDEACETAQALARAGCDVHLIWSDGHFLPGTESIVGSRLQLQLRDEGVRLHADWHATALETIGHSKGLKLTQGVQRLKLLVDEVIVATGSAAALDRMALAAARIESSDSLVTADSRFRTTNPRIFAVGAALGMSSADERMVAMCVRNALLSGGLHHHSLLTPRFVSTDPQLAQIGHTAAETAHAGTAIDTYQATDGDSDLLIVHTRRGTGRVVGATIVAPYAAELIGQLGLLIDRKISLRALTQIPGGPSVGQQLLAQIARQYSARRVEAAANGQRWFPWSRTA